MIYKMTPPYPGHQQQDRQVYGSDSILGTMMNVNEMTVPYTQTGLRIWLMIYKMTPPYPGHQQQDRQVLGSDLGRWCLGWRCLGWHCLTQVITNKTDRSIDPAQCWGRWWMRWQCLIPRSSPTRQTGPRIRLMIYKMTPPYPGHQQQDRQVYGSDSILGTMMNVNEMTVPYTQTGLRIWLMIYKMTPPYPGHQQQDRQVLGSDLGRWCLGWRCLGWHCLTQVISNKTGLKIWLNVWDNDVWDEFY